MALHNYGGTVLGLADEPYESLRPDLRSALREYYRVGDMHRYDELLRALGYFTHRYGRIDRLDSFNEYWLETEAALRTDFNIPGIRNRQIPRIKRKSLMREAFEEAGIPVARGRMVRDRPEAEELIAGTGYPVVAKPDIGVGAAATYKIQNEEELDSFFAGKPAVDYLFEEYIRGQICTFDGLTDHEGRPVFTNSLIYSKGVMETVLQDDLIYYYTDRQVPADLEATGRRLLQAFEVRERFFHFEFFRRDGTGDLVALEVNMRPPGGLTTDMFNYSCDIDVYNAWAAVVSGQVFPYPDYTHKYYCCYASRKSNRSYAHSHDEILQTYGDRICQHEAISGIFSIALGNYGYLFRSPDLEEVTRIAEFIQA